MVHGCMVYTERAETAAVSLGTSHAEAISMEADEHYELEHKDTQIDRQLVLTPSQPRRL